MKTILLIDGSNQAYRAYYAYKRLSYKGKSLSMIYGFPSMLKYLVNKFEPNNVLVAWDQYDSTNLRKKILPSYKDTASRKLIDRKDFERQKKALKKLVVSMGVTQISNEAEADDVIYSVTKTARKKGYKVIIVSGDKDFHQLLAKGVTIWNESKKVMITHKNCKELFGYEPHQCVSYLCLVGDTSDNIKGYPGIGPVKALNFLSKYDTLENFIQSDIIDGSISREKILEISKINPLLIDLSIFHQEYLKGKRYNYFDDKPNPKVDDKRWSKLCKKYGLLKFRTKNYLEPFKTI
jgi:DNA polymerase-1